MQTGTTNVKDFAVTHRSLSRSCFDNFLQSHGGILRTSDHNPSFSSRAADAFVVPAANFTWAWAARLVRSLVSARHHQHHQSHSLGAAPRAPQANATSIDTASIMEKTRVWSFKWAAVVASLSRRYSAAAATVGHHVASPFAATADVCTLVLSLWFVAGRELNPSERLDDAVRRVEQLCSCVLAGGAARGTPLGSRIADTAAEAAIPLWVARALFG